VCNRLTSLVLAQNKLPTTDLDQSMLSPAM
jgi:hypothetical protein